MSYNNYYMRLRVKAVQEFDRMYHEPEYKAKCHKRVWKRLGCYIFGISYQSYLDYLKMDVSDVPPTPLEAQQAKRNGGQAARTRTASEKTARPAERAGRG